MIDTVLGALRAADPTPPPDFDLTSVTPGWVGFAITFLVAAATVLLLVDMVRRVRRTRYRGEIQERLEAERQAADLPAPVDGEPNGREPNSREPKPKPGD